MSLAAGTRLGPYEIAAAIGAGGMGEVYRATDSNLKRSVAIKVLPASVAADVDRLARFQREAEVLAALNHPNIAAIYGLEKTPDFTALVMELVEGEDLSQRIARGAMALDEALPMARQIADALEAAHEQGIIHRDLKPANIRVRPDGTVKVLDFGLAKALEQGSGIGDRGAALLANSPTITSPAMMTGVGVILGTAAYMAPEQARGKAVDKRADLWAYGCVVFEMLTGRRAFEGQDVTDTIAAIVRGEPDWSALPAGTPASVKRLLKRCLAKDSKLRLREAGSAIVEIDEARTAPDPAATAVIAGRRWPAAVLAAAAVAMALLVAGYIAWPRPPVDSLTHLAMPVAPAAALRTSVNAGSIVSISEDGRRVAFLGVQTGAGAQLFVRALDQSVATAVPGTSGATGQAFSPDGRWLSYGLNGTLFRIEVGGGAPQAITALDGAFLGAAWIDNESLTFATSQTQGIMRVRAAGGEPVRITTADTGAGQFVHAYPSVAPGGRFLVFTVGTNSQGGLQGIASVVPIEGGTPRTLLNSAVGARATASGHLLFLRDGNLMAVSIDLSSMQVNGDPVTAQAGIDSNVTGNFAVAANGTLAFISGAGGDARNMLTWLDQSTATPAIALERNFVDPRISPDGRRLAVEITSEGDDIWVLDLVRATPTRLTFENGEDETPAWSPDGEWIAYSSDRPGQPRTIFRKRADGSGPEEKLWANEAHMHVDGWTPDGRALTVTRIGIGTGQDVWLVPIGSGAGEARALLQGTFNELNARVSADGRWLAYTSNESGEDQVYVQPFPALGAKWQVSSRGGSQPVWAPDGRRLFYRGERALMVVDVQPSARAFSASVPRRVADDSYTSKGATHTGWDIGRDGRMLVVRPGAAGGRPTQIQIVQHWLAEVSRRSQVNR
jgi:Tol biopolymer transport system component